MARWRYAVLFLAGLAMAGLAAVWVRSPGYMDADYYFATGRVLASGGGLRVPFLWNYLAGGYSGVPQPAHLYWMPLTTFLAAASMALFGFTFTAAQLPSIIFTGSLPVLSAWMARRLGAPPYQAMLAGGLAILCGFYLPFFVTTDAFSSFAVIGGLALWFTASAPEKGVGTWCVAGILAGFGHLARADGILLVLLAAATWAASGSRRPSGLLGLVAGYLVVMGGWFARMWSVTGGPLSPGGLKTAWLTDYNQLFAYPADQLTPASWISSGLGAIVQSRLAAAGTNLASLLLVNGLVFLTLLMAIGFWRKRQASTVRILGIYLVAEFALMTLVFPFPGARGGYFHSTSAAMPLLWALAPIGLESLADRLHVRWGWERRQAGLRLGVGALVVAGSATFFLLATRQIFPAQKGQGWGQADLAYSAAAEPIHLTGGKDDVVAVNNPPGFWLASGQPSIVIPDGGPQALGKVVQDVGVAWVVLEPNHPPGLDRLYADPTSVAWLELVATTHDAFGQPLYTLRVMEGASPP